MFSWSTTIILTIIGIMAAYLRVYSKFFCRSNEDHKQEEDESKKDRESSNTVETQKNTKGIETRHLEEHGLNPFNDPDFRPYLKDYTNLSKEENRRLVAEFIFDEEKSNILEWLCSSSFYSVPYPSGPTKPCDLSTIAESSHGCDDNCICIPTQKKPEKYLNHYHSDGILEKLHHDLETEASREDLDLTQSLIQSEHDVEDFEHKHNPLKQRSSSLTNLSKVKDKTPLCQLIQKESQLQKIEMKVRAEIEDGRRLLIGAVKDNVIYLSIPQINLFHYLIENRIIKYLKTNWNDVQDKYNSYQDI